MVAIMLLSGRYRYLWLTAIFLLLMGVVPRDLLLARQETGAHFYRQYFLMISDPINIDFLAGMLAAFLYPRMSADAGVLWRGGMLSMVIYFLFAVGWQYAPLGDTGNVHTSIMTFPCFLLFLAGLKFSKLKPRHYPGWLLFTGKISYSLYLLHMAVIFSLITLARQIFGADCFDDFSYRFNLLLISLLMTFFLSWVSYLMIEVKFSVFLRDKLLTAMKL